MPARRCSTCSINWPNDYEKFKDCPACKGKTDLMDSSVAMTESETNHKLFAIFCLDWDAKKAAQEKANAKIVDQTLKDLDDELTDEINASLEQTPSIPDPPAPVKADEKPESD